MGRLWALRMHWPSRMVARWSTYAASGALVSLKCAHLSCTLCPMGDFVSVSLGLAAAWSWDRIWILPKLFLDWNVSTQVCHQYQKLRLTCLSPCAYLGPFVGHAIVLFCCSIACIMAYINGMQETWRDRINNVLFLTYETISPHNGLAFLGSSRLLSAFTFHVLSKTPHEFNTTLGNLEMLKLSISRAGKILWGYFPYPVSYLTNSCMFVPEGHVLYAFHWRYGIWRGFLLCLAKYRRMALSWLHLWPLTIGLGI